MKRVVAGILSLSSLLSGCAATMNVPPELRRQAAAIAIVTPEQVGARTYAILGEVVGRSCTKDRGSDPSMEVAREELRINATPLHADAIASVLCKEGGLNLAHNCWKSIECRGDAIRWTS